MPVHEIEALRVERRECFDAMKAINDKAIEEKRSLTAEEQQEYDQREQRLDALGATIERQEHLEGIAPKMTRTAATEDGDEEHRDNPAPPKSYQEWLERREGGRPQDAPAYREQFYRWLATGEQPSNVPDELRVQSKATAGAGANLVPTSFEQTVMAVSREFGAMSQLARILNTDSGETIQVPTVTAHGAAAWTGENVAFTPSDETFGQASLSAYKAATIVLVSEELLADSAMNLEQYLANELGQRFGVISNTAYVAGDGVGKPTGITTTVVVGVTAATGNTTTIPSDNLFDLFHSVKVPYRRNGSWLANDASVKAVRKLKDTTNQYIWQPGLQAGAPDTLLGRPFYADPDMPAPAANAKSVLFGDFQQAYTIRNARGLALQRLVERYADNGQVGFRGYIRTDGKQLNTEAVKAFQHSAT